MTLDDCGSSTCSFTYDIDPLVNPDEEELTYFTGLTSFGFSGAEEAELRKIRGMANFTENETSTQTTLKGEVYRAKCGLTDEKVLPMAKIKALTFVCKDRYICRANQMDATTWNTVDVEGSKETTTSKDIVEGWYFETPPED